jgi:hypothetical protein
MAAALHEGWRALFADLLAGRWRPRHLDAGQLVRHALSLHGAGDLVLVVWEPANADAHPEVLAHRAELERVLAAVDGAAPRLHATTWDAVIAGWAPARPAHAAALRERYAVAVTPVTRRTTSSGTGGSASPAGARSGKSNTPRTSCIG